MDLDKIIYKYLPSYDFVKIHHYENYDELCRKYNISKKNYIKLDIIQQKEIYEMTGGGVFKAVFDNVEFEINYYVNKSSEDKIVFIVKQNSTDNDLLKCENDYSPEKHCAMLSYKNHDKIYLMMLNSSNECFTIQKQMQK
jgi:hypothetical protein